MNILTTQENKIAALIALGFIEKEIAAKLYISAKTVHTHTKNLRLKMGAKNIADVTRNYIFSMNNKWNLFDVEFENVNA